MTSSASAPRTLGPSLALLAATAVWGATFVTVKAALADADTWTFLTLRFAVGAIAAWLLSVLLREHGDLRAIARPGLLLGALMFGGYALQTLGLQTISPSRSSFITGLTVLFVPFVVWRLERKTPPLRAFVAPFIALIGLQRLTGARLDDAVETGDLLTIGCALVYAVHIALMSRLAVQGTALRMTALQLGVVSLLSACCWPFGARHFEPTPALGLAVLSTGIVASAVAVGIQAWAQRQLPAVRASVIYALEPVFTVGYALLAGVPPSDDELIGGAFVLTAMLISELPLARLRFRPMRAS